MVALWVNRDLKDLLDEQLERLLLDNECRDLDELSKCIIVQQVMK